MAVSALMKSPPESLGASRTLNLSHLLGARSHLAAVARGEQRGGDGDPDRDAPRDVCVLSEGHFLAISQTSVPRSYVCGRHRRCVVRQPASHSGVHLL